MENAAQSNVTSYKIDDAYYHSNSVNKLRPGDLIIAGDAREMGGLISHTFWLPNTYCVLEVDVQMTYKKASLNQISGIVICLSHGTKKLIPHLPRHAGYVMRKVDQEREFSDLRAKPDLFTWRYATQKERDEFIAKLNQHVAYPHMHGFLEPTAIVETTKKWLEEVKPQAEKCLQAITQLTSENEVIVRTEKLQVVSC
ncbi:hypothetical protein KA013_05430 [Patescibacteria group bacterium]|nr:hypothetical protein [Patescibacteria group bacterium]